MRGTEEFSFLRVEKPASSCACMRRVRREQAADDDGDFKDRRVKWAPNSEAAPLSFVRKLTSGMIEADLDICKIVPTQVPCLAPAEDN